MANTNPLTGLKIKKLIGFKHITPGVITGDLITALKQCGIDALANIYPASTEFSAGNMDCLGNRFYGLKADTKSGLAGYFSVILASNPLSLKEHPVQTGFRLTQSAMASGGGDMVSFSNYGQISVRPAIQNNTEDTSVYYEAVLSLTKDSSNNDCVLVQVYVNKRLVSSGSSTLNKTTPVSLKISSQFFTSAGKPFSYVFGDAYIAELDYNSDGTVTPQLLGNLTLEPFTVESYTGDKHINTKNQDIVTALNTLDPNNDMGALAIKPVEQPASVTFNVPDVAGKSILGASLNIVYKDSIAPNNRLNYQITEGTTQLQAETIMARNADITGYTTFSKILTTPEGGGAWNADNLKFKLDMVNNGAE
ncbi:TPA: hypothetical protein ACGT6A_005009 [Salmonella enterica]|nr:hypothetical protein [Salmonella enterica subsp. enterica serovar Newport]